MYGSYDPNLNNQPMTAQNQAPPNFQQAPVPQNFAQSYTPIGQLDAAAIAGMNQVRANAINAANAPKTSWQQSQDLSNNIFGNVIAPFAEGLGLTGGTDIAKTFKDQIESDRKTRSDMLKSNIDQIKDITSTFDNLNRTQVAELGRETANTRALQALQESANRKAAAEASLAETARLHNMQKEKWDREDQIKRDEADRKKKEGEGKLADNATKTKALVAKYDAQTGKLIEQTKQVKPLADSKIDYQKAMGKAGQQRADNGTANATERGRHNQATEGIQARNAATGEKKAATQEQVAQYKQEHPKLGKYAAALALIKGEAAPQTAQASPVQQHGTGMEGARSFYNSQSPAEKAKLRPFFIQKFGHPPD